MLHLYAVAGTGPLLVEMGPKICNLQRFVEVPRGVLRCCPLSSFYLDFLFRLAVPMRHVIFLREVGGDWYLQLCKSLLFLSAGYWGSGAETRGRI